MLYAVQLAFPGDSALTEGVTRQHHVAAYGADEVLRGNPVLLGGRSNAAALTPPNPRWSSHLSEVHQPSLKLNEGL